MEFPPFDFWSAGSSPIGLEVLIFGKRRDPSTSEDISEEVLDKDFRMSVLSELRGFLRALPALSQR